MTKKEKRLDPRVQRTRQFIREAFLDLLAEKGYDTITVQAITERARINRATFYLHYVDKQDLLNQSIEEVLQELVTFLKRLALHEHTVRVVYLFDHVARHAHFYQTMLADLHLPVFTARLSEIFYETWSQALVQFQPDERRLRVSKDVLISYVTGGLLSVLIWWLNSEMPYTSEHMAKQYLRIARPVFLHAIGKDALTVEFDE